MWSLERSLIYVEVMPSALVLSEGALTIEIQLLVADIDGGTAVFICS
jgi:hypothetical protein